MIAYGRAAVREEAGRNFRLSVLWPPGRSDQGAVLGRHRVCAAVQASGGEAVPMAAQRAGAEAADKAGVSLAHGGIVHRAEEGLRARETEDCLLK